MQVSLGRVTLLVSFNRPKRRRRLRFAGLRIQGRRFDLAAQLTQSSKACGRTSGRASRGQLPDPGGKGLRLLSGSLAEACAQAEGELLEEVRTSPLVGDCYERALP